MATFGLVGCVMHSHAEDFSRYVCEKSAGEFVLCKKEDIQDVRKLTLNEIVTNIHETRLLMPNEQKLGMAQSLKQMAARKYIKAYTGNNCLSQIIGSICLFIARLHNWLYGYGFRSAYDRALILANFLEKKPARPALRIAKRPFRKNPYDANSPCVPIRLNADEIKGCYIDHYANEKNLDPRQCKVVSGPFTYYNAHLSKDQLSPRLHKIHNDIGWGCAWRSILNQLNKIREELLMKGLGALDQQLGVNKAEIELGMHDIQRLTGLKEETWLEPVDSAELFLRYTEEVFPDENQPVEDLQTQCHTPTVKNCFFPKGFLFLNESYTFEQFLEDAMQRQAIHGHSVEPGKEPYRLIKLYEYFHGGIDLSKIDEAIEKLCLKDEYLVQIRQNKDFLNKIRDKIQPKPKRKELFITLAIAYLALKSFYQERVKTYGNIDDGAFPRMDDNAGPVPLMIDDTLKARNIFGYHINPNDNSVSDLFLADVHVGHGSVPKNPWLACGWQPVDSVLKTTNQLMMVSFNL